MKNVVRSANHIDKNEIIKIKRGSFVAQNQNCWELVEILGDPAESFSIALSFENGAHDEFERSAVKLRSRNFALAGCLAVQAKDLSKFVLGGRSGTVNFVPQDQDGTIGQLLVRQQGVQFSFGLDKAPSVA